jgi:hypothetical protein
LLAPIHETLQAFHARLEAKLDFGHFCSLKK